jgi:hypothetical protein
VVLFGKNFDFKQINSLLHFYLHIISIKFEGIAADKNVYETVIFMIIIFTMILS